MQTSIGAYFKNAKTKCTSPVQAIQPLAKRARLVATKPSSKPLHEASSEESSPAKTEEFNIQIEEGWQQAVGGEFNKGYFSQLGKFLTREKKKGKVIYPPRDQIFRAFELSPWERTRVVIIGQDPYHGPKQANGLAFSVAASERIPPSLRNIFKEAHSDVGIPIPTHGCLDAWARQGVLLLNTVLTVTARQANSHKKQGWEKFTDAVIAKLNKDKSNLVFLLWGRPAQQKASFVNADKHLVLTSSHPSPLGATKTNKPFIGSKCFSRTNEYLKSINEDPVDWKL